MDKYTRVEDNTIYKYMNSGLGEKRVFQEYSTTPQTLALGSPNTI